MISDDICLISYVGLFIKERGSVSSEEIDVLLEFAEWLEQKLEMCIYKEEVNSLYDNN